MTFAELERLIREFNARSTRTWSGQNLAGDRFLDADVDLDASMSVSLDSRDGKHDWALWKHVQGNMAAQEGPYSYELEVGEADSLEEAQEQVEAAADRYLAGGDA